MPDNQTLIRECPHCKKRAFRRLDIFRNHIMWKCKSCSYTDREKLFPIQKKIIYLDQLAYSHILKSTKVNKGDKWQILGNKIRQLVEDQITVCPYSTIHQTETEFYRTHYKEITELYRQFSQGVSFKHPFHIEKHQLYNSLGSFFSQNEIKPYEFT